MDRDALPGLESMLCFDLYAASRALMGVYRRLLAEHDLTYPQYLVLVVLWHDGRVGVKDLAQALHLDYGTLSPLLRRMEASGLLTRERSTSDERSVEVTLTERGDRLRTMHRDIQRQVLGSTGLDHEQAKSLQQTLRTVSANAGGETQA